VVSGDLDTAARWRRLPLPLGGSAKTDERESDVESACAKRASGGGGGGGREAGEAGEGEAAGKERR